MNTNGRGGFSGRADMNGDRGVFRTVLGRYPTGVIAVTAADPRDGRPCGLAANSFTSVSLTPPLVSFCVAHTSTSWPRIAEAGRYCLNLLGADQEHVCRRMARAGGDKFAGLAWRPSPSGSPILDGALAWIDCRPEAEHRAGDHVIVVSRVLALEELHDGPPLVFYRGGYGSFQDDPLIVPRATAR